MAWTYNSVRIFVQSYDLGGNNTIARLQPLASGTVYQHFGYELDILTLTAYVVGNDDAYDLRMADRSSSSYALVTPYGAAGNFYLKSLNLKLEKGICQTLRTDLADDAPVFLAQIELYIDE